MGGQMNECNKNKEFTAQHVCMCLHVYSFNFIQETTIYYLFVL